MNINQAMAKLLRDHGGILKFVDQGNTSLNLGVLQIAKLAEFIKEMKESTVLLDAARLQPMTSDIMDIDRITQEVELESPVRNPSTGEITLTDQDPTFAVNTLEAKKFRARTRLTQDAIDVNIEGQGLMNTMQTLLAQAGGRAMERVFLYGDTSQTSGSIPSGYKAIDGWIKSVAAGQILYGGGAAGSRDFDPSNMRNILETMKDKQKGAYVERSVFFVPPKRATAYQRQLKDKDSDLGDQANLQGGQLTCEGRPVIPVPALQWRADNPTFFGPLDPMFFGPPENFVYGMFKDIQIRIWEDIDNELWKLRFGFKGDSGFENENNVVLGLPDVTKP